MSTNFQDPEAEQVRRAIDQSWFRVEQLQRRVRELPLLDPRSADEIIGYDEIGLPGEVR